MKKLLLALATPLLFTACEPEEGYQITTIEADVINVTLPDTIELGDTADIMMTYKILNECGVYAGTDVSRDANNILIRPLVTYTYEGNNPCPENVTTEQETVQFNPKQAGKYLLYFKRGNNYLADTLIVKQ